jgi:hypothetical protein
VVAVMAIEDKEAINPGCSSSSMLIEVLNPFKASLIGRPTILRYHNNLVLRQWAILVPRGEVIFALDDNE